MAQFASAPPAADLDDDRIVPSISVPVWEDEDPDDFAEQTTHDDGSPTRERFDRSPFPSPPPKGNLGVSDFYQYSYSLEHLEDLEYLGPSEEGPSAPPFEVEYGDSSPIEPSAPSAPPLEIFEEPSAPPLEAIEDEAVMESDKEEHRTDTLRLPGYHP